MRDGRSARLLFTRRDDTLPQLYELLELCIRIFAAFGLRNNRLAHSQLLHFVNLWFHVLRDRRGQCGLTMRHAVFAATEEYAQVWRFAADVASLIVSYDSKEVHLDVVAVGFRDKGPGNRWLSKSAQRARGGRNSPLIRQNTCRRRCVETLREE